jgi:adenine-specific DNA-methyltransferase
MEIDINDIIVKQLVKWFIKLTKSFFENNGRKKRNVFSDQVTAIPFEIALYILILYILKSNDTIKEFELISKRQTKKKTVKVNQLFKKHSKILKYFGYSRKIGEYNIDAEIIKEAETLLSSFPVISPVIIIFFYDASLSIRFKIKKGTVNYSFDNSHKKNLGIFYTPQKLASSISKNALDDILDKKNNKDFSCKILDPSCGSGIFLYQCFDEILKSPRFSRPKKSSKPDDQFALFSAAVSVTENTLPDKQDVLLNSLFGLDIDTFAVKITKTVLLLRLLQGEKTFCLNNKTVKSLDKNIIVGSYFDEPVKHEENSNKGKDKIRAESLRVQKLLSNKYDIIIGNPPWITLRKNEIGCKKWDYLKGRYKSVSLFKMNTFPIFVEKSIEIMKKGSSIIFITPQRILDTPSYSELRKILIGSKLISYIDYLEGAAFKDVVADSIILHLNHNKNDYFEIFRLDFKNIPGPANKKYFNEIVQPDYKINITSGNNIKPVIEKIDSKSCALKKYFDVHVGMMIKDKKLHFSTLEKGTPVITSKCFSKFSAIEPKFIDLTKSSIFGGTKDPEKQTRAPKVIIRKTGQDIVSTIDFFGNYVEQSCYLLLPKENIDLLFICGLLNSDLVKFYFQNNLISNPLSYPYIQHYDLEKIPLFSVGNGLNNKKITSQIKSCCSKMFSIPEKSTRPPGERKATILFEKLMLKLNSLVFSLYELTDEEIHLIQEFLKSTI